MSVSPPEYPPVDLGDLPAVMTAEQIGPIFNKSTQQLANERYFGRGLPYVKYGSRDFYLRSDVVAFLAANRHDAGGGHEHRHDSADALRIGQATSECVSLWLWRVLVRPEYLPLLGMPPNLHRCRCFRQTPRRVTR